MKFFNSLGVNFKYHGDVITWMWPWARTPIGNPYHSSLLNRDFNSFSEYWVSQGEERAFLKLSGEGGKLYGFDLIEQVIPFWSSRIWPNEYLVCLTDVNPKSKGPKFWALLDSKKRSSLLKDVVVLRCKDLTEMEVLLDSIDISFAKAFGVLNGAILECNDMSIFQ